MRKLLQWVRCPFPARWASGYAIPLRLIVGFGFMQHGYAKLARGADSFAGILHALGMPAPDVLAWLTIVVELLGGLAVLVGAFIPLAAVPMAIILIVATITVHWPNGFSSIKLLAVDAGGAHFGQPGYETDLLYLAALVALVIGGSGPLALDAALLGGRNRRVQPQPLSAGQERKEIISDNGLRWR
jgi:putative oxidoreductase